MSQGKKSKLERIFEDAKSQQKAGVDITPVSLRQEFGLTKCGASCILYMLEHDEYYPELEKLYLLDEFGGLEDKDEWGCVKFLADTPPYKQGELVFKDISARDRAIYFSMGAARAATLEEVRQYLVHLYVCSSQVLNQARLDTLEAIAHHNRDYFSEIIGKPESEIRKRLRPYSLKERDIQTALRLLKENK